VPWLDTSRVRSAVYRPLYRLFFWIFVLTGIGLGYLGSQSPDAVVPRVDISYVALARILTFYYFAHFLIVMPLIGILERPKPMPSSITESVLAKVKDQSGVAAETKA
jgi:ubiquinol-cytochrome c reductase cytochrome b subunit